MQKIAARKILTLRFANKAHSYTQFQAILGILEMLNRVDWKFLVSDKLCGMWKFTIYVKINYPCGKSTIYVEGKH